MTERKERAIRLRQSFLNSVRMIDVERAVIITEAYQKHEADSQIVKKALALDEILQRMSIKIRDDELIMGNQSKNRRGVPLFPEYAIDWIKKDMDTFSTRKGDQFQITEEQKETLRKIFSYWEGRTLRAKIKAVLPSDLSEILEYGVFTNENYSMSGPGHMIPNYEFVIQIGLINIKKECDRLNQILKNEIVDIAFVGIGENGHLAFNDPPANFEIEDPFIIVNLDSQCRKQQVGEGWFESIKDVPQQAISMSIQQIMKTKNIICTVPGERKAQAVKDCFGTNEISPNYPASILKKHKSCFVFLDYDSAKHLPNIPLGGI